MTNLEIILLVNVVFLQTIVYALLAMQRSLNLRIIKLLDMLTNKGQT